MEAQDGKRDAADGLRVFRYMVRSLVVEDHISIRDFIDVTVDRLAISGIMIPTRVPPFMN